MPDQIRESLNSRVVLDIIPALKQLDPTSLEVTRVAFAKSFQVLFQTMVGISALGFLASFMMRQLPLHTSVDSDWGMRKEEGEKIESETSTWK